MYPLGDTQFSAPSELDRLRAENARLTRDLPYQLTELKAENARLRAALRKLANEVMGSMPLMEPLARQQIGNTNYTVLIQRAEEARAELGHEQGSLEEKTK